MVLKDGEELAKAIRAAGSTPPKVAALAGISKQYLWRMLTQGASCSDATAARITTALYGQLGGQGVDQLFKPVPAPGHVVTEDRSDVSVVTA